MSERQREALRWFNQNNVGAVLTRLGWTWRQTVRENPDAAEAVLERVNR